MKVYSLFVPITENSVMKIYNSTEGLRKSITTKTATIFDRKRELRFTEV